MYSISPQPDASLFFNAPEGPDGNVTHRMRRGYSAWFRAVLELLVASLMSNLIPAVFPQTLDHFTAAHATSYTLLTHPSIVCLGVGRQRLAFPFTVHFSQ